MFKLSKTVTLRFNINLRRMLRINVHFVLFLTYGGIKKEIIATTFTIFTFIKRQQSYNTKKSYPIFNNFLGYKSLNFKRVWKCCSCKSGILCRNIFPKMKLLSLDVTCVVKPYCQQNMPLAWYCQIYFWQFSVISQWHA
jgi:hypothetical protein